MSPLRKLSKLDKSAEEKNKAYSYVNELMSSRGKAGS